MREKKTARESTSTSFAFRPGDMDYIQVVDIVVLNRHGQMITIALSRRVWAAYRMAQTLQPLLHPYQTWQSSQALAGIRGGCILESGDGRRRSGFAPSRLEQFKGILGALDDGEMMQ